MSEYPEFVPKKLRRKLDQVNANLKSTRSLAEKKKLLARKRLLKSRIAQLDPNYAPPDTRLGRVGLKLLVA